MTKQIDLNKYRDFVEAVTSDPSNDLTTFIDRMDRLDANYELNAETGVMEHGPDINVPLLITACFGLAAESGEFIEIPKKILFQGKPLTHDNVTHMAKELGDVMWYWVNAARAINIDPNQIIQMNIEKLQARYPGGSFDAHYSENRKVGDL